MYKEITREGVKAYQGPAGFYFRLQKSDGRTCPVNMRSEGMHLALTENGNYVLHCGLERDDGGALEVIATISEGGAHIVADPSALEGVRIPAGSTRTWIFTVIGVTVIRLALYAFDPGTESRNMFPVEIVTIYVTPIGS